MDENERKLKHCIYCGARAEGQVYCPNCGKLVVTIKGEIPQVEKKTSISEISKPSSLERVCTGCSSVITSTILEQCPICNTMLEPIPDYQKPSKSKPGFIFTDKKLKAEQKLVVKKDSWSLKEGLNVFVTCLLIYMVTQLFLVMFVFYGMMEGATTPDLTIELILLSQIPGIVLGIYPLRYIYSRKHDIKKLGFTSDSKKIILALFIGIGGCLLLLAVNYLSGLINSYIYNLGLEFLDIGDYIEEERNTIKEASLIWIIILLVMLSFQAISTEIVFRGVLQNTLREKFVKGENHLPGKLKVIFLVALAYSLIYILFSFLIGIIFFILNLMVFIILGILYEINQNIYNTIIASIFYYNLIIILMVFY